MRQKIYFHDLALLAAIYEHQKEGETILITQMKDIGNAWLERRDVPVNYATNFNSDQQRQITVAVLESVGLLTHIGKRGGYEVTGEGEKLLLSLDNDWRNWILVAPIKQGKIDFSQGKLADHFRKEL